MSVEDLLFDNSVIRDRLDFSIIARTNLQICKFSRRIVARLKGKRRSIERKIENGGNFPCLLRNRDIGILETLFPVERQREGEQERGGCVAPFSHSIRGMRNDLDEPASRKRCNK